MTVDLSQHILANGSGSDDIPPVVDSSEEAIIISDDDELDQDEQEEDLQRGDRGRSTSGQTNTRPLERETRMLQIRRTMQEMQRAMQRLADEEQELVQAYHQEDLNPQQKEVLRKALMKVFYTSELEEQCLALGPTTINTPGICKIRLLELVNDFSRN